MQDNNPKLDREIEIDYSRFEKVKLLKDKYKLVASDEITAVRTLEKLDNYNTIVESETIYEFNKDGSIKNFYPTILAEEILRKVKCINLTGESNDTLVYKNGVYEPDKLKLRGMVNRRLIKKDPSPEQHRIQTLKEIREKSLIEPSEANNNKYIINFQNGIYDIKENKLQNHTDKIISTIQVKSNYLQNSHKDIDKTLFGHLINTSLDEDTRYIMQEIFGYCLTQMVNAQKFFLFYGKAHNGKSQIIKVLQSLFHKKYVSSLELKHFQDDVRVYSIFNKQLNLCSDISSEYIEDDAILKRATGEDTIHCNPKFRDGFDFDNFAKIVFSCNELPNVSDKTDGFMRRVILVPFDRRISESDKVDEIGTKIINDKETMEMVCSWAVEGLQRLIKNNFKFTEKGRIVEAKKEYDLENNNVKRFIHMYCKVTKDENLKYHIPIGEFKTLYEKFCQDNDYNKLGAKNVKHTLDSLGCIKAKNSWANGWYYKNVAWNSDVNELTKDQIYGTIYSEPKEVGAYDYELPWERGRD